MIKLRKPKQKASFVVLCAFAALVIGFMTGCKSDDKKLAAMLWNVDPVRVDLYRVVVKPDGKEVEQFYHIPSNPDKMKEFSCMLAEHRKEVYEAWTRCNCSL